MVNEIVAAIARRLAETFGEDVPIYVDEILQGFTEPCFFILVLAINQKQVVGGRYFREHAFDIQYFPSLTDAPAAEIETAADRLWMALEYIGLADGPARGTAMRCETHDGVLHFFVNYNAFVLKGRGRGPLMQVLKQSQKIKP